MNVTLSFYECRFSGWDTNEVIVTHNPYAMQKNLFELFALTGGGDKKISGVSTCTITRTKSPGETFTIFYLVGTSTIYNVWCREGGEPLVTSEVPSLHLRV